MFDTPGPRLFALAPGVDFPSALVAGLRARLTGHPPEVMARVELIVNTQRMRRRVTDLFAQSGAGFLPRIRLVTDLARDPTMADLPAAIPPLRRRLELTRLIAALLDVQPDLAPRSAIYDLSDSLATLMDEMQGEGVPPDKVTGLDVSDHSAHWKRTQDFLRIVTPFFDPSGAPDVEARQRRVVERLIDRWQTTPPDHPVIVAGSTGSRGTTALLMQAVARLPQGALVLPGFDFDLPGAVWQRLDDAMTGEDHPQYRFWRLIKAAGATPRDVAPWHDEVAPNPARNRLISLSLRPAPVTDAWLSEGRMLTDIATATDSVTLIEAASARTEALAIAMRLRKAAEDGQIAALITPDRGLTRQVTAALDRWGILPDDSAGRPLALSAPGRLLRQVVDLFGRKLTSEKLLALLKHPVTASGGERGKHLLWTRDLELDLRRKGPPFPTGETLVVWAATQRDPGVLPWAQWLAGCLDGLEQIDTRPLPDHVAHHIRLAEALAAGPDCDGAGKLWLDEAGVCALAAVGELQREAEYGGSLTPADYGDLFTALLTAREVRNPVQTHPAIMIWGTLEARVQGADLVILGGLNDGIWPQMPAPDPWLNRKMRQDAGLLLPERRIGLSAHDYQQAVSAREVVISRAVRNAEAETVPSRWLNRLVNLLGGLADQGGPQAIADMRARGAYWVEQAIALETPPDRAEPAHRPAPRPPVAARPRELPVTGITTLIRDPYAIYARYVLGLRKLDPLNQSPDARLRGSLLHKVLERFIKERGIETPAEARVRLLATADAVMVDEVPWPGARALWRARLERAADWFVQGEEGRTGTPAVIEKKGSAPLTDLGFTLTARPDRIDVEPDGRLHILDYKTGLPPTAKQQQFFDKQLLLEAAMAEHGAFRELGPCEVAKIAYIGLGTTPKTLETEITPEIVHSVWDELHRLIATYMQPDQPYPARRAVFEDRFTGDYDHLARYGEWEMNHPPKPEDVG
jgi:ATP-dependent helicase/nuclease subunit B